VRRKLTPRSLAVIAASGVLCAALVYAGHRSLLIAILGGVSTLALVTVALWPGEGSRNRLPRRRDSGETMNRRITPSSVDVIPSDLRVGEQRSIESVRRARQDSAVRAFLRIVRDATGYDDVIFWRAEAVGAPLAPIAWSSDFTDPPEWPDPFRASVDWAAESRLTVTDGKEPPDFVAGPVGSGTLLYGVLSFAKATPRVQYSATDAKKWLDRSASHLALLVELLEVRNEFQRQSRHSQALLQAAYKIQSHSSSDSLGPAICETALDVTSATRSALIDWNADLMEGRVESVSAGHPVPIGFRVTEDSLVGQMCARGTPLVKEDLRPRGSVGHVYADDEPMRELGSLGIIPLKREDDVIGAVVIEGELPGDVINAEARNVSLLATVASVSLQISWKIEETSKRARTDQLTGLSNRRHFDEQLQRVLTESDRWGTPASLLLADLDYFKQVNDNHGHDAGDAVLRHTASVFMETIRAVDVCARYGGEELAILLPQTNPAGAMELAERLRQALESRPVRFGRSEITVTASFGLASYPESAPLRDGLFPAADKALYRAKADGRNCVRVAPVTSGRRAT